MPRPNILLIHSDQHRYDCVGVNGHPLVQTPNLDRLAREGVNFSAAFTPAPVCVPSRNSMHFGCWPTEHLAIANPGTEAPRPAKDGLVSYSEVLRGAGYYLASVGKWHLHPERQPQAYGFHQHIDGSNYRQWRAEQQLPPVPHTNGFWGELDPGVTAEQTELGWGASRIIDLLHERSGRQQPFFIRWDTSEPHLPNILPEPYCSQISPADIPPWPSFQDSLANKPYIQGQQRRSWELDDWGWDKWAPIVARYLGQVSLLDAQIGRILDAMDSLGLTDNTLVIYTTDHGDLCGGHGMIDKHYVMYEDVTHVPLIVRWPGQAPAGTSCDAFVSHALDLAKTFCEVAETEAPASFAGLSLVPLLRGVKENGRDSIISMYFGNQFGLYSQRMLRDRRYKLVWNLTAEDELYDLANDPGELVNLAANASYSRLLAQLRLRLVAWMEDIHDPMLNMWTRTQLIGNRKI